MNTTFDVKFEKEKNIKFYPYVGDYYDEANPKIMVMGESHYISVDLKGKEDELIKLNNYTNTTREAIDEQYRPFAYTVSMLTNTVVQNEWAYEMLAFYNFFQKYVGYGSADKSLIDDSLIEQSQKALFSIIEILKPKLIIAWGRGDLYKKWVPQVPREECELIEYDGNSYSLYRYKQFMETYIWHMPHPSGRMFNLVETTNEFVKVCEKLEFGFPITNDEK
jgi:hypothetical protein